MELKKGYKQTEMGAIPEDWEVKKLADFADLLSSKRIFESDYVNMGIPFYRGKEISLLVENKTIDDMYYISEEKYEVIRSKYGVPQKNDILITAVGTLGNVFVVPNNNKFYFKDGNLIWLKRIKGIDVNYFALQIKNQRNTIIDNSIGSSQKALTIITLKDTMFQVPPTKAEQTAIATVLSDMDALILSMEKLIAKKRAIMQGAIKELLKPKEGWEVKKLGDIGTLSKGAGIKKDEACSGNLPCIRYGEIYTKHSDFIKEYYSFISEEVAKSSRKLKRGDILFAGSGETKEDIGKCVAFIKDDEAYAGGDIVIISPINVDSLFLGYYLNTPEIVRQKASRGQGDAIVHISTSSLQDIIINLPVLDEQTQIATILSDMDAEIAALEAKLSKYKQIKQGMMQNLLSGRIRLV